MRVVTVKWGKVTLDVDWDALDSVSALKTLLHELTGVPPVRQKVMAKGSWKGVLKDDAEWADLAVTAGQTLMLMGSSEGAPVKAGKVVFVEDMTAAEVAKAGAALPCGLINMGNTCYMNSTLQMFRSLPELRAALRESVTRRAATDDVPVEPIAMLGSSVTSLYEALDTSVSPVPPLAFWTVLRELFPQFSETDARGASKQQDAEEFMNALMMAMAELTHGAGMPGGDNAVDALFGVEFEVTMTCRESADEPPVVVKETARKLICNIEGGAGRSLQVNHLTEGIHLALEGDVEKRSELLGRDAVWTKTSKISRLPPLICVQFLRFFWKATPDSRDHAGVKCKMMRPVSFPAENLDLYPFCVPRLQSALRVWRDFEDAELMKKRAEEDEARKTVSGGGAPSTSVPGTSEGGGGGASGEAVAEEDVDMGDELAAALALSLAPADTAQVAPAAVDPLLPEHFSGLYDLVAVVTHKGRSADSGHYMGWVCRKGDTWLLFDDDEVSECKTEDIVKLKGGGDWPMAYLCMYRAKTKL